MSLEIIALIALVTIAVTGVVTTLVVRRPKTLDKKEFSKTWRDLQTYCKTKQTWPLAIEQADKLLNKALKKRKFKGETMGARMVSAQKTFTDNDSLWSAHNFYKQLLAEPKTRIKESDIRDALVAYRQGLRDLGALPERTNKRPLKVEK